MPLQMKNTKTIFSILVIWCVVIFSSCNKTDAISSIPPVVAADGFTWTENGGTIIKTGSTPFFLTQSHNQFVQDSAGTTARVSIESSLITFVVGTYNLGPNYYVDFLFSGHTASNKFDSKSDSIIIASDVNSKISGTFTATGPAGTISSIMAILII